MEQVWPLILVFLILTPIQILVVVILYRFLFRMIKTEWQQRMTPKAKWIYVLSMSSLIGLLIAGVVVLDKVLPGR